MIVKGWCLAGLLYIFGIVSAGHDADLVKEVEELLHQKVGNLEETQSVLSDHIKDLEMKDANFTEKTKARLEAALAPLITQLNDIGVKDFNELLKQQDKVNYTRQIVHEAEKDEGIARSKWKKLKENLGGFETHHNRKWAFFNGLLAKIRRKVNSVKYNKSGEQIMNQSISDWRYSFPASQGAHKDTEGRIVYLTMQWKRYIEKFQFVAASVSKIARKLDINLDGELDELLQTIEDMEFEPSKVTQIYDKLKGINPDLKEREVALFTIMEELGGTRNDFGKRRSKLIGKYEEKLKNDEQLSDGEADELFQNAKRGWDLVNEKCKLWIWRNITLPILNKKLAETDSELEAEATSLQSSLEEAENLKVSKERFLKDAQEDNLKEMEILEKMMDNYRRKTEIEEKIFQLKFETLSLLQNDELISKLHEDLSYSKGLERKIGTFLELEKEPLMVERKTATKVLEVEEHLADLTMELTKIDTNLRQENLMLKRLTDELGALREREGILKRSPTDIGKIVKAEMLKDDLKTKKGEFDELEKEGNSYLDMIKGLLLGQNEWSKDIVENENLIKTVEKFKEYLGGLTKVKEKIQLADEVFEIFKSSFKRSELRAVEEQIDRLKLANLNAEDEWEILKGKSEQVEMEANEVINAEKEIGRVSTDSLLKFIALQNEKSKILGDQLVEKNLMGSILKSKDDLKINSEIHKFVLDRLNGPGKDLSDTTSIERQRSKSEDENSELGSSKEADESVNSLGDAHNAIQESLEGLQGKETKFESEVPSKLEEFGNKKDIDLENIQSRELKIQQKRQALNELTLQLEVEKQKESLMAQELANLKAKITKFYKYLNPSENVASRLRRFDKNAKLEEAEGDLDNWIMEVEGIPKLRNLSELTLKSRNLIKKYLELSRKVMSSAYEEALGGRDEIRDLNASIRRMEFANSILKSALLILDPKGAKDLIKDLGELSTVKDLSFDLVLNEFERKREGLKGEEKDGLIPRDEASSLNEKIQAGIEIVENWKENLSRSWDDFLRVPFFKDSAYWNKLNNDLEMDRSDISSIISDKKEQIALVSRELNDLKRELNDLTVTYDKGLLTFGQGGGDPLEKMKGSPELDLEILTKTGQTNDKTSQGLAELSKVDSLIKQEENKLNELALEVKNLKNRKERLARGTELPPTLYLDYEKKKYELRRKKEELNELEIFTTKYLGDVMKIAERIGVDQGFKEKLDQSQSLLSKIQEADSFINETENSLLEHEKELIKTSKLRLFLSNKNVEEDLLKLEGELPLLGLQLEHQMETVADSKDELNRMTKEIFSKLGMMGKSREKLLEYVKKKKYMRETLQGLSTRKSTIAIDTHQPDSKVDKKYEETLDLASILEFERRHQASIEDLIENYDENKAKELIAKLAKLVKGIEKAHLRDTPVSYYLAKGLVAHSKNEIDGILFICAAALSDPNREDLCNSELRRLFKLKGKDGITRVEVLPKLKRWEKNGVRSWFYFMLGSGIPTFANSGVELPEDEDDDDFGIEKGTSLGRATKPLSFTPIQKESIQSENFVGRSILGDLLEKVKLLLARKKILLISDFKTGELKEMCRNANLCSIFVSNLSVKDVLDNRYELRSTVCDSPHAKDKISLLKGNLKMAWRMVCKERNSKTLWISLLVIFGFGIAFSSVALITTLKVSRQGKLRLAKWYGSYNLKERQKFIKEITPLVLSRKTKTCNFIEYRDMKIVYRRYASLYFIAGIDLDENELLVLETIHRYVETLDRHFENVCELDLIFNFPKAHFILDEFIMAGEVQEPSMKAVLRAVQQADDIETADQEDRRFF